MKDMLLKVVLLAVAVVVSGLAVADKATYEAEHKAAVAALDKAKKVGGEWSNARWKKAATAIKVDGKNMSYLHAAEAYAAKGDYENAIKYAELAKSQGEMGYQQAMEQRSAAPRH